MSGKKNPGVKPAPNTVRLGSRQAPEGGWRWFWCHLGHSWPVPTFWECLCSLVGFGVLWKELPSKLGRQDALQMCLPLPIHPSIHSFSRWRGFCEQGTALSLRETNFVLNLEEQQIPEEVVTPAPVPISPVIITQSSSHLSNLLLAEI